MGAFGLSFGKKKQTVDSTTGVNKQEATTQATSGTRATTGTTSTTQNNNTTGSTTGQQTNTNTGQQTNVNQSQQVTSSYNAPILAALEQAVSGMFGGSTTRTPVTNFNADQFVQDQVARANVDINSGLESNINQLIHNVGGTAANNSMTALLANRLQNDAAGQRAGVRSEAVGQAQTIQRENALAANQVTGTDQAFLGNLLQALKGGVTASTGAESQQTQQTQTGTTTTAEQSAQQQSGTQVQQQNIVELLSQLLNGITNTTGTEKVDATTKEKGGGFSLAL